jgi:hypothetical protein
MTKAFIIYLTTLKEKILRLKKDGDRSVKKMKDEDKTIIC